MVVETGDSGPVTPIGINLPNDQAIREKYGSKSVALSNVNEAYDKSTPGSMRSEFAWSPEEAERAEKFGDLRRRADHRHARSDRPRVGPPGRGQGAIPQALIKEHFSALEEGRADLVGLYFIADPKLVELGIIPAADHDNIVRAEYEAYTRNAIVQLRRIREGTQIEEDHMRNRQMIVRWLMANTKAIEERTRDGKTYLVMVDPKAFRDGVGRLLAEVQRIKSEGDYAAAQEAVRHLRHPLRSEAARRGRGARRQAEPAVLHRLRDAEADAGDRRGRRDHRRDDLVSAGPDDADAGVLGADDSASSAMTVAGRRILCAGDTR